jgi:uncharacterized protein (UPF0548 family)
VFALGRPSDDRLDAVLADQADAPYSYEAVGATRSGPLPEGYRHDRRSVALGSGQSVFDRAVEGLRRWELHRAAGTRLRPVAPPLAEGVVVVQAIAAGPLTVVAPCRIVYVVDEPDAFGFGYGTLAAHPEEGEERFLVVRSGGPDGEVAFEITSFSRPRHVLAQLGRPVTRFMQVRVTRRYLDGLRRYAQSGA